MGHRIVTDTRLQFQCARSSEAEQRPFKAWVEISKFSGRTIFILFSLQYSIFSLSSKYIQILLAKSINSFILGIVRINRIEEKIDAAVDNGEVENDES